MIQNQESSRLNYRPIENYCVKISQIQPNLVWELVWEKIPKSAKIDKNQKKLENCILNNINIIE